MYVRIYIYIYICVIHISRVCQLADCKLTNEISTRVRVRGGEYKNGSGQGEEKELFTPHIGVRARRNDRDERGFE